MNIVQLLNLTMNFIDRTKSPRFPDAVFITHLNNAILDDVRDRFSNIKQPTKYQYDSTEEVMRDLYTLKKDNFAITPSGNTIPYPNDYFYLGRLFVTVSGYTSYAKPLESEMEGPLMLDPFRKPSGTKFYYIETNNTFRILYTGNLTGATMSYLKYPAIVSMGQESDKVFGGGTLQTNTLYLVYYDCVYNPGSGNVNYASGSTFTTTSVTILVSGIVIPYSVITDCDMPVNIQNDICKRTAETLIGSTKEFQQAQFLDIQSGKD